MRSDSTEAVKCSTSVQGEAAALFHPPLPTHDESTILQPLPCWKHLRMMSCPIAESLGLWGVWAPCEPSGQQSDPAQCRFLALTSSGFLFKTIYSNSAAV